MAETLQEIGVLTAKDDDGTVHELYPVTKTEAVNGLDESLATKVNTADIVDNLESTSTVLPLSANQGNVLNSSIQVLNSELLPSEGGSTMTLYDMVSAIYDKTTPISVNDITLYFAKIATVNQKNTTSITASLKKGTYLVFSGDMSLDTTNYHSLRQRVPSGANIKVVSLNNFVHVVEASKDTSISIGVGSCGAGSNGGGQGFLFVISFK